jgi:hypothetical protein
VAQYIMVEIEPAAIHRSTSAASLPPPAATAPTPGVMVSAAACGGATAARHELATLVALGLLLLLGCGGPCAAGPASSVLHPLPAPTDRWLGGGGSGVASARGLDWLAAAAPRGRCGAEAMGGAVGALGGGPCGMEAAAPRCGGESVEAATGLGRRMRRGAGGACCEAAEAQGRRDTSERKG